MSDKENVSKRPKSTRKSNISQKEVLVDSASSESSNNYEYCINLIQTLQNSNEILRADKDSLIQSFTNEISVIKSTYGSEIDALRKALDESTKEKCSTDYSNKKLFEENSNLKIKFARKIETLKDMEKKYKDAEANLIITRDCAEQYESINIENEDLRSSNTLMDEQLKSEISKRTEAEIRAQSLNEQVEFYKRLNENNNNVTRDNNSAIDNKRVEVFYSEKYDADIKAVREELSDEFDLYKEEMELSFSEKLSEMSSMNSKLNEKLKEMYNEKRTLQIEFDNLHSQLASMENKMADLNARDARHREIVAKINKEHEDFIKDIFDDNEELKDKLHTANLEKATLLNEKMSKEKEDYKFRSMLQVEQSRLNMSDIASPKRRKVGEDNDTDITTWSKDYVKIFCDAKYNGSYIQMLNDGLNDINLNEWKIEIETQSGVNVMFTFPPKIMSAGQHLKVWSYGQKIADDEYNMVMNVKLPLSDIMTCKLTNDMDGMEASFDLKKIPMKRKILKANVKKLPDAENSSIVSRFLKFVKY